MIKSLFVEQFFSDTIDELLSWSPAVVIDSGLGRIIGEAIIVIVNLINSLLQD